MDLPPGRRGLKDRAVWTAGSTRSLTGIVVFFAAGGLLFCLKLVSVSDLEGDKDFSALVDLRKKEKHSQELTAIIKDEEKCIRCALCAMRCPVGAITME